MLFLSAFSAVERRWRSLVQRAIGLRHRRRAWWLVGRWLRTEAPDKSTYRRLRHWWHLLGLRLQEIKAAGRPLLETVSVPPRGLRTPEGQGRTDWHQGPATSYSGASSSSSTSASAPHISVQVNVTVGDAIATTNTGSEEPVGGGDASRSGRGYGGRGTRRGR